MSNLFFQGLWQRQKCQICPPALLPLFPTETNIKNRKGKFTCTCHQALPLNGQINFCTAQFVFNLGYLNSFFPHRCWTSHKMQTEQQTDSSQNSSNLEILAKKCRSLGLDIHVPPPDQQTVAWSGWQLLTERTQMVWRPHLSLARHADYCQEKAPLWLLLEKKTSLCVHHTLDGMWRETLFNLCPGPVKQSVKC